MSINHIVKLFLPCTLCLLFTFDWRFNHRDVELRYKHMHYKKVQYHGKTSVAKSTQDHWPNWKLLSYFNNRNINGDIIVAGLLCGVLGMDRSGRHRFSYKESESGFQIRAKGICTDSLLHILVSDSFDSAVHMLNQYGQFLCYLLTTPNGACPSGLMFDFDAHLLWIRAKDKSNRICAYRYIKRHDVLAGKSNNLKK